MAVSNPKSNTLATYTLINNWKVVILDAGMQLIQTQLLTPSNKPFGNKTQPSTGNPKVEISLVIRNNEKLITSQIQTDTRFFGGIEAFNTIIKAANETDFANLSPIESVIVNYQGPPQPVNPVKILYKISGTVIDTETELPLDKVKIMYQSGSNEDLWPKTFTDEQGNYELEAEIEISQEMGDTDPIPTDKIIDNEIPITFTKDEYNTEEKIPYAKDDTVITTQPIQRLEIQIKSFEDSKTDAQGLDKLDIQSIKSQIPDDPQAMLVKKIMEQVKSIAKTLIPAILAMLAQFGITKLNKLKENLINKFRDKKKCPDPAKVRELILRRNQLVRKLNQIWKIVDTATKIVGGFSGLLAALQTVLNIVKNLPIPTSVPPGVGVPLSLIEKIRERIEKYQQIIGVLSTISVAVLSALLILNVTLRKVIQLLNLLDLCLQDCAEGEIDQEEVDAELLAAITLEANDGTPAGPYIVNGFTLEVQEESQENAVGSLKRRFAVGKNSQGIILLKGEKSFSSGDQILLNELKFYIESNNLQAD